MKFPPLPEETTVSMLGDLYPTLFPRQLEVLLWVVRAKRDKEIGALLGISAQTVTTHVRNLLARLGWESRAVAQAEVYRDFILRARGERG